MCLCPVFTSVCSGHPHRRSTGPSKSQTSSTPPSRSTSVLIFNPRGILGKRERGVGFHRMLVYASCGRASQRASSSCSARPTSPPITPCSPLSGCLCSPLIASSLQTHHDTERPFLEVESFQKEPKSKPRRAMADSIRFWKKKEREKSSQLEFSRFTRPQIKTQ